MISINANDAKGVRITRMYTVNCNLWAHDIKGSKDRRESGETK